MRPNLERWSKIKRLCAALLLVQENWQSLELSPEQVTGDDVEVAGIDGASHRVDVGATRRQLDIHVGHFALHQLVCNIQ